MTIYILILLLVVACAVAAAMYLKNKDLKKELTKSQAEHTAITKINTGLVEDKKRLTQADRDLRAHNSAMKLESRRAAATIAELNEQVEELTAQLDEYETGSDDDQLDPEVEEFFTGKVAVDLKDTTVEVDADSWTAHASDINTAARQINSWSLNAPAKRVAAIQRAGINALDALDSLVAHFHNNPSALGRHKEGGNRYYQVTSKGLKTCFVGAAVEDPMVFEEEAFEINGKTYDLASKNGSEINGLIRDIGGIMNFLTLLKPEYKIGVQAFWKVGQLFHDNKMTFDANGLTPMGVYAYRYFRYLVIHAFGIENAQSDVFPDLFNGLNFDQYLNIAQTNLDLAQFTLSQNEVLTYEETIDAYEASHPMEEIKITEEAEPMSMEGAENVAEEEDLQGILEEHVTIAAPSQVGVEEQEQRQTEETVSITIEETAEAEENNDEANPEAVACSETTTVGTQESQVEEEGANQEVPESGLEESEDTPVENENEEESEEDVTADVETITVTAGSTDNVESTETSDDSDTDE